MKLIMSTSPPEDAERIANELVSEKLVACANVIPGVRSHFWWEGSIRHTDESILIMKTTPELAGKAIRRIEELHPYVVPEAVVLDITDGLPKYMAWLTASTWGG